MNNENCCPEFNLNNWDKKIIVWNNKKFIKESIPTFFHIPFPPMIGQKITKMWKAIEEAKAVEANKENTLILFRDPSSFRSEIYISTEKEVPGENNVVISGNFASRVFDGGYNEVPRFLKEMNVYLNEIGKKSNDYYIHYAYCPKCATKYKHNYMIIFARI